MRRGSGEWMKSKRRGGTGRSFLIGGSKLTTGRTGPKYR